MKVLTAWILLIAAVVAVVAAFAARGSGSAAEPSGLHGTVRELLPDQSGAVGLPLNPTSHVPTLAG